jgi:hypothetical protein
MDGQRQLNIFEKLIKVVGERSRCATIASSRKSNRSIIGTTRELKKYDVFFPRACMM